MFFSDLHVDGEDRSLLSVEIRRLDLSLNHESKILCEIHLNNNERGQTGFVSDEVDVITLLMSVEAMCDEMWPHVVNLVHEHS